jgi:hypothetical protein
MEKFFIYIPTILIRQKVSIIPSDKNFSTTFLLTLVHGGISFEELQKGLENLKKDLQTQSGRREGLVRDHYGLFIQCAEGLEWLKAYKKGGKITFSFIICSSQLNCIYLQYTSLQDRRVWKPLWLPLRKKRDRR